MRARLMPVDGGPPIDLVKDLTLFGRDDDCDVRLDHKSVSKLHCVVVKTDGLLLIRDLGSTNGTRVNGQRIRRAALLPNDQLTTSNLKSQANCGTELEAESQAPVSPPAGGAPLQRTAHPRCYPAHPPPRH